MTDDGALVCAFTGHRTIEDDELPRLRQLTEEAVARAYSEGYRIFLSGGAIGFDTLAAQTVLGFRMTHPDCELRLLLPCENQDEKWSTCQSDMYRFIVAASNSFEYVSRDFTDECMAQRNRRLANSADMLVSFIRRERSGSAQTVRMAEQAGKKVVNLYEIFAE